MSALEDFDVYPSTGSVLTAGLAAGCAGVISGSTNISAALARDVLRASGAEREVLQARLTDFRQTIQKFPLIPAVKQVHAWRSNDSRLAAHASATCVACRRSGPTRSGGRWNGSDRSATHATPPNPHDLDNRTKAASICGGNGSCRDSNPRAHWPVELQREYEEGATAVASAAMLVSETDRVRVWHLLIPPGKRCGFHRHVLTYFWTAHNPGKARGYFEDGRIVDVEHYKGETKHLAFGTGEHMVHAVENIGTNGPPVHHGRVPRQRQHGSADTGQHAADGSAGRRHQDGVLNRAGLEYGNLGMGTKAKAIRMAAQERAGRPEARHG